MCPILRASTIFCWSKRSIEWLDIKLNDLNLSTHVALLTINMQCTLWWSVNLSHNWAFNVWKVNFIKTPTTINTQVNCNRLLCVLGSVCIVTGWSIYSHPHTKWYSQSQTIHTLLSYQYVYLRKPEYVSQSKCACIQHSNHAQLLES